jgi:hypothetical protein
VWIYWEDEHKEARSSVTNFLAIPLRLCCTLLLIYTFQLYCRQWGAGIAQWYSAGLWSGWSWVWVLAGAGNSLIHCVWSGSGAHPASYPVGTRGSFSGGKVARGMKLTTHLHLVLRSRMRGAIPPLFQHNFMAWCAFKPQGQLYLHLCCRLNGDKIVILEGFENVCV